MGIEKAHILRVHRNLAGVSIPFDKLYFFRKEAEKLLPRIFRDAMVFPITKTLTKQVEQVLREEKLLTQGKSFVYRRRHENPVGSDSIRELLNKDHLMLVPVLFTKKGTHRVGGPRRSGRKKKAVFPHYLIARPQLDKNVKLLRRIASVRSYFILDGKKISPICLMCPRHTYFLQGACSIGMEDCYTHLAQARTGDMVRGVQLYKQLVTKTKEPFLELK